MPALKIKCGSWLACDSNSEFTTAIAGKPAPTHFTPGASVMPRGTAGCRCLASTGSKSAPCL
ncbi:hypothetical protein DJ480_07045 [Pseudomonas sp. Leaf98]|nr:hypothetical protein DJ480_07045 [Pseudomonas sp. Leaf98]